ncbi:hypothetical protein RGAI101_175 [Roseobacter sp. GAI101]|nr:hypothetical protein RGAI101_175 [Roseobacter sp. GAI101]
MKTLAAANQKRISLTENRHRRKSDYFLCSTGREKLPKV